MLGTKTGTKKGVINTLDTGINTIDDDSLYGISTNEKKLVNRIKKLKELHQNEVQITVNPEDNEGIIVARFPKDWLKINPPREVSEKQRETLAKARQTKTTVQ